MTLKPGTRLFSAVCSTEMITVRAPALPVDLTIGGAVPAASADRTVSGLVMPDHGGGAAMGKRYVDADNTIELLCVKPGEGRPALGGVLLELQAAKPLPASD
jgi:hypothetical protein